jgi:hypothetical protein
LKSIALEEALRKRNDNDREIKRAPEREGDNKQQFDGDKQKAHSSLTWMSIY